MQELTGFFYKPNEPQRIYEVKQNTEASWLKEEPDIKYLVDTWELVKTTKKENIYKTNGDLIPLQDFDSSGLKLINTKAHKLLGNMGLKLVLCLNDTKHEQLLEVQSN